MKKELVNTRSLRREACFDLRSTMRKAAQLRLTEKEKTKSPSYAMRISMKIDKVVWSMLIDGKSFAETEINDMVTYHCCISFCALLFKLWQIFISLV